MRWAGRPHSRLNCLPRDRIDVWAPMFRAEAKTLLMSLAGPRKHMCLLLYATGDGCGYARINVGIILCGEKVN